MPPPVFPPVRPIAALDAWGQPQVLTARPRTDTPQVQRFIGQAPEPQQPPARITDPWHYATLNGSQSVTVGTTSVNVIAAPPNYRNLLIFRNVGLTNLYIDFGSEANVNRSPILLIPSTVLLLDTVVPQDDVYCISDAAGGILGYTFSNL